jgi:hypothetical protein
MREEEPIATAAVELLLREPEIVAWLDDYRQEPDPDDDERPTAA